MGRLFRRRNVAEPPSEWDGVGQVPTQFNFTRDVVEASAADPHRTALRFVDAEGVIDKRTFRDVAHDASRWAALLRARGLEPGDRVIVLVGRTPVWHAVLLGALKAGFVAVPCSESLTARELETRVESSGARLLVVDLARAPVLAELGARVEAVVVEDVATELRGFETVQPTHDTAASDTAFILYTSGTTGAPKGATHTHAYTWALRLQAEHWLDARPGDLVWCTRGTGGAKSIWNVLLGPWSCGAQVAIHEERFDPEQRVDLIDRLGVTVLCQTPTEYREMAEHPMLRDATLGRLRHAVSIGEPLDPAVIEAFRDAFGLTVHEGYGQTEATVLVANARDTEIKPGSMGLPMPGHEVAVIDDDGNEQPVGIEGDIALNGRPPSLFSGYWGAHWETSAAFRGPWYLTGDRATRDADGYLWFTGRTRDAVLGAAQQIDPSEIDGTLVEQPAVAASVVVARADPGGGEFVLPRPDAEPSSELVLGLQDRARAVTTPDVAAAPAPDAPARELEERGDNGRVPDGAEAELQAAAAAAAAEQAAREEAEAQRAAEAEAAAAAEQAARDEADAQRAAEAEATATAEQARRDEAEARRSAEAEAGEGERQRTQEERRRQEAARAAAVKTRREAEERRTAERRADEERRQAQQHADERGDEPAAPVASGGAGEDEEHEGDSNPLVTRLNAYGRQDDDEGAAPAE